MMAQQWALSFDLLRLAQLEALEHGVTVTAVLTALVEGSVSPSFERVLDRYLRTIGRPHDELLVAAEGLLHGDLSREQLQCLLGGYVTLDAARATEVSHWAQRLMRTVKRQGKQLETALALVPTDAAVVA